ncbi:MAG: hypothetical protein LBQ54_08880 [Planctomycetaceae bacterium]|jgi:hypothetical protein|nr:hypothetical protein [Planctomycetaceae bacterium]
MQKNLTFLTFVAMMLTSSIVLADFNTVNQVRNDFNSLNGGDGAVFTVEFKSDFTSLGSGGRYQGEIRVHLTGESPSLRGYSPLVSSANSFQTFCIQSQEDISAGTAYTGTLNLSGSSGNYYSSSQGRGGTVISKGTAMLYQLFASGKLLDYNYSGSHANDAAELQEAFWKLQGQIGINSLTPLTVADWTNNRYLNQLMGMDSNTAGWLEIYDPTQDNSDYIVLVMNNQEASTGANAQNFLYLSERNHNFSTPEPATFCLWGLGCTVFLLRSRRKSLLNKEK